MSNPDHSMRIARALALAGVASRRKCEEFILKGLVRVDGRVIRDLGRRVDTDSQKISFRGRPLKIRSFAYYVVNKPKGYTSTAADRHAKRTVYELLPSTLASRGDTGTMRVFSVGRLDRDSRGLLLFTNDGDLANRLMHPRHQLEKCYRVRLDRPLQSEDKARLMKGIRLSEGKATMQSLRPVTDILHEVVLTEGKNRQVRRMFAALGYKVRDLGRTQFGPLSLGRLKEGRGRFLEASEVAALRAAFS